jgi:hypothetical protein
MQLALRGSRVFAAVEGMPSYESRTALWRDPLSRDAQGEERHSADWDSLKLFKLEVEIDSIHPGTLRLPPGIVRGWISTIVAFCDAGLFVQAGLSKEDSRMDYVVAQVDLSQRTLRPIANLSATFM